MDIKYRRPKGVDPLVGERPLLSTGEGGYVAVDDRLLSLWNAADGKTLGEVLATFQTQDTTPDAVCAGLACLAEGGLLQRERGESGQPRAEAVASGELVSAVVPITSQKEQDWLGACLTSLFAQKYDNLEVIVVDNATSFGLAEWLATHHARAKSVRLERRSPFSAALNQGVARAAGAYFLLLNSDLKLEPDAVAELVAVVERDPSCGAVAAKLKFWWAPQFLNGLGNRVRDFGWGTDNAIGHLDLGQFDHWETVPSACFAAALIPRKVWEAVGPLDEGFQLYYEDADWCYRARMLGYPVRIAPRGEIKHIFSGWVREPGKPSGLTPWKLRNAAYGRLRFASKIVGPLAVRRFLRNYLREDVRNFGAALKRLRLREVLAYLRAWWTYLIHFREIRRERRTLQARRVCSDEALFGPEETMPRLLFWRDLPELTWESIVLDYLPHIRAGRTRPLPELEVVPSSEGNG